MEEISSLDSFGADSNARPESSTPRLEDQEQQQTPVDTQDTPASPPAEDAVAQFSELPPQDQDTGKEPEEEFEQISEGSLDAEDNQSQDKASASPQRDPVEAEQQTEVPRGSLRRQTA